MNRASMSRIGDWLRIHAQERPNALFITDGGKGIDLTFSQVHDRVCRLARALEDLGVARGSRVGIMSADSHLSAEVMLTAITMGATIVPLNPRLARREVDTFLNASGAVVLLADARSLDRHRDLKASVHTLRAVIGLDGEAHAELGVEALVAASDGRFEPPAIDDGDILRLAFTSGTTGRPKGVLQSHGMLKQLAIQTLIDREFTRDMFQYNGSPLYHVSGFSHLLTALALGYRLLTLPAFDPAALLEWMSAGRLTHCFFVPTMIGTLLQQPGVEGKDYRALVSMGYGAAPMAPALLRRAMEIFQCDFLQIFGCTEVGSQTVLGHAEHRRALAGEEHLLGSVGKAAFNVEVTIRDDEMRPVPVGEVGEIVTRGDVNMSGYLDMPEETAAVMRDGWFRSGDLGRRDADGYVYLVGRKKELIIRGGENIYPIDIEAVLFEYPGVHAAAVIGTPDPHWGEIVTAYLATDWKDDRIADLRRHCRERLAPHKVPVEFIFMDALPVTATGKVDKPELRRLRAASAERGSEVV